MKNALWSKIIALIISQALLVSSLALAQDDTTRQTRPRRVSEATQEATVPDNPATGADENPTVTLSTEPTVRIGLATDARSVTVSTGGVLLHTVGVESTPAPLAVSRVRIEPRSFPSLSSPTFEEQLEADSEGDIPSERRARDAGAATGDTAATGGASRRAGAAGSMPGGANASAGRDAGADDNARRGRETMAGASRGGGSSSVRLASRATASLRGAVVYASGAAALLELRAPITFASDADDSQRALRFNEKAYRGRLEVFANTRGTLTVVNVIGLEDYVRGVVPNELSPGGYPALEALKAQAVAARTYAVSHRGQFSREGFDLLPTTRSQVYGGRQTEHPLTDRAVAETRGRVATYKGEVINALYTSTCGGRTEDSENIFGGEAVPYLRSRECAAEGREAFAPYVIRTSREPLSLRDAEHLSSARDAALLSANGFAFPPARVNDEWLSTPVAVDEVRAILSGVSLLARQPVPPVSNEVLRAPAFATALMQAVDGESRADVLLNKTDVEYLLAFRDADEIPARNRPDVALLLRDGHLDLYPDATLRPRLPFPRARALRTVARLLEARGLLRLQRATARSSANGALVLRPPEGRGTDRTLAMSADAYLFRAFGDALYPVREVSVVGGEPVVYHLNARGEVDYMEVRPAPNGATAERSSPFTNWVVQLTPAEVAGRLGRRAGGVGSIVNLRAVSRGASRRVLDLEVTGTDGTAHVRGGRIRSALGLREQLFVVERRFDDAGRLTSFVFTGRGWGHGVGMCQVGAYGLARGGWTYDRILKAYYMGIALTKLY